MAVEIDLKTVIVQQSNGTQVLVKDNTGDYDAVNNPTGWGDGTTAPAKSAVTQITFDIAKGDLAYQEIITDSQEIEDYLNTLIGKTFNVQTMFGSAYSVFEDGLYTIQITIAGTWSGIPSPYEIADYRQEYFLWKMWYDIRQLVITMETPIINYLESYNISLLNALFDDILFSCQIGNITNANKIYNFLRNTLDNETVLTELFKNFRNYDAG